MLLHPPVWPVLLQNNSRCFANGLYELGLKPGDSLAVWTDNNSENVVSYYACAMAGIKMVSIDPKLSKDSQLSYAFCPRPMF